MAKLRMFRWLRDPKNAPPREFYQAEQPPYGWGCEDVLPSVPIEVLRDLSRMEVHNAN